MKIRSLLLGSLAAAGLATGAHAADLGVLTSLDVCDSLGISGLTISSDTNCLQISGGVNYEFDWGDYRSTANYTRTPTSTWLDADDGALDFPIAGETTDPFGTTQDKDWESRMEAWLQVVATSDTDFGRAKAVIGLRQLSRLRSRDGGWTATDTPINAGPYNGVPGAQTFWGTGVNSDTLGSGTGSVILDEAYVSVGDSTVIMAGKRKDGKFGSIANIDDDTPFNYLGTIQSSSVGSGVLFDDDSDFLGGDSIQIQSDVGNGVSVGVALENIAGDETNRNPIYTVPVPNFGNVGVDDPVIAARKRTGAGTLLGVVNYAGDSITAHLTGGAIGVLDGQLDSWFAHAGATGTFDNFKLRAAVAYLRDDTDGLDMDAWNALVSAQATFDMFTLALSGEYANTNVAGLNDTGWGVGGSVGAKVTDGIQLNLGGRYFHDDQTDFGGIESDQWQIEAQIIASVTETVAVTGAVGVYGGDITEDSLDPVAHIRTPATSGDDTAYYGSLGVAWNPGGGFSTSLTGLATSEGGYKATFKAAKTFQ
ncbi:MAG TPA: hypothetical protein VGM83_16430 [Devosiaceae bacterium]|jgi:hypothetical protein